MKKMREMDGLCSGNGLKYSDTPHFSAGQRERSKLEWDKHFSIFLYPAILSHAFNFKILIPPPRQKKIWVNLKCFEITHDYSNVHL